MQESFLSSRQNIIHLNGSRSSYSARKNQPLKIKLDTILSKDYSDWRSNKVNFNVLNSQTAKNTEAINQYITNIYQEYQIKDPLDLGNSNFNMRHFSFNKDYLESEAPRYSFLQKKQEYQPIKKTQELQYQRISYKTPVKQHKKGLQIVNKSVQKSNPQKNIPVNNENAEVVSPHKVKFVQRTAPSQKSSFLLDNSRNRALSSSGMGKSYLSNDYNQIMTNSRFSSNNKINDKGNQQIMSNQLIRSQHQLQITPFNTTRQFLKSKTNNNMRNIYKKSELQIGTAQSLGQSNPQRETQRKKNQLYASAFLQTQIRSQLNVPSSVKQPIKQSFRYCVGCQSAILQANIQFHEQSCNEFKMIFSMQKIDDIINEISHKIETIIKKINIKQQSLRQEDKQTIIKSSRRLVTEIESSKQNQGNRNFSPVKNQSFKKDYQNVMNVGKNWGLLTEQVNKLKWFLLVKDRFLQIKQQTQQAKISL